MNDQATNRISSLSEYALLGRSGLRVSPLCLGTMTFGTDWGWGAPKEASYAILKAYLDAYRREIQAYFPVPAGSPVEAFSALAGRYPVFALERAAS